MTGGLQMEKRHLPRCEHILAIHSRWEGDFPFFMSYDIMKKSHSEEIHAIDNQNAFIA